MTHAQSAWLALAGVLGVSAFVGSAPAPDPQTAAVTYAEHVAPIFFKNCVTCHRPGEAGPFSLLTYEGAKTNGAEIAEATRDRYMPPWKPGPSDYPFVGDRRLSDADIDTIQRWVKAGMPQGDPRRMPPTPVFSTEWAHGKPDLVVKMPEPFTVPAQGKDLYRNFVIPLNLSEDKWVKVVDYRPSARAVVHHAIFVLDPTGAARKLDADDSGPGFGGVMGATGLSGRTPADLLKSVRGGQPLAPAQATRGAGAIGGWVPGAAPVPLRDDLAFFVPKGSDLVVATHFHSNGQAAQEQSTFALYFAKKPPSRGFSGIQLPPFVGALKGINIPAGEANYVITDSFVVPMDLLAFSVGAHAHYIGKEVSMKATFPNGTVKTLLNIPDWDLNWQGRYEFKEMVALPAGTKLDVRIRYDNSAANPNNPSNPPQRVTFGEQSTNEMGSVTLNVVAAKLGGLVPLRDAYEQHLREAALNSPAMRGRGGGGR